MKKTPKKQLKINWLVLGITILGTGVFVGLPFAAYAVTDGAKYRVDKVNEVRRDADRQVDLILGVASDIKECTGFQSMNTGPASIALDSKIQTSRGLVVNDDDTVTAATATFSKEDATLTIEGGGVTYCVIPIDLRIVERN